MVAASSIVASADEFKNAFNQIGFMQLKGEVDNAKATLRLAIDGSDTAANQLTPGTILVYRTSDGNYGKLQVIEYGYNLLVRWQTSKPNGQKLKGAVQLLKQTCSWAHVAFDDESVADFFNNQVDQGRQPEQFARIWVHTHPGECPQPSLTDEETFDRVFGRSDWAVMFIIAGEGQTYARLRFNVGPGGEIEIPVEVDYSRSFLGSDLDAWEKEYLANVGAEAASQTRVAGVGRMDSDGIFGAEPSELNGPFFVGDQTDDWQRVWPDDEFVASE